MLRASGVASTHIGHPSVIPHRARRAARPNSAPSKKRILCDRHHTASAMAELVCYLSIVPHMRSFDVPPKHSAPLTRGLFCAARLSASRTKKSPAGERGSSRNDVDVDIGLRAIQRSLARDHVCHRSLLPSRRFGVMSYRGQAILTWRNCHGRTRQPLLAVSGHAAELVERTADSIVAVLRACDRL